MSITVEPILPAPITATLRMSASASWTDESSGRRAPVSTGVSANRSLILRESTNEDGDLRMDEVDQQLLARLRENARAPVAELARALGLSRTTVQSRLARLERSGVIAGYSVRLADSHLAGRLHAYVLLTVEPKQAAAVTQALKRLPGVRALQSVSGPYDMIAVAEAGSVREMDALIDEIGGVNGVERTNSSIVLSTKFER
jgi:DNA-binding Lrp family transcriptional regulator